MRIAIGFINEFLSSLERNAVSLTAKQDYPKNVRFRLPDPADSGVRPIDGDDMQALLASAEVQRDCFRPAHELLRRP